MSERVVFRPARAAARMPFDELGRVEGGAWGVVDDRAWLAPASDESGLELLYLARADYVQAVRGLSPEDVAVVIEQRRTSFAPQVPSLALGLVELRVRDCIGLLGQSEGDAGVRADLLTALASFTMVPRFLGTRVPALLDYLREGDARIIAELESPSLRAAGDLDPGGAERAARRRFAIDIGLCGADRGRPERAALLPYHDVERVYLVTPWSPDLESEEQSLDEPTMRFRGGLVMALPERNVASLEATGHRTAVVFPARAHFLGASATLTPAQLDIEVNERLIVPGFAPYVRALRLHQATLRSAVALIVHDDVELRELLAGQLRQEASSLGAWMAIGNTAPAPGLATAGLRAAVDTAEFLVAFCQRRGALARAGTLAPLTRALSHVVN